MDILLATTNVAKEQRLRNLLDGLPLHARTPNDAGLSYWEGPHELGISHKENACLKAEGWSQAARTLAIASDGGLVIPVLGHRWKSVLTHRFAGEEATDRDRALQLLQLMEPYTGKERCASWVEALAIADEGRTLASWQVEGPSGLVVEIRPSETVTSHKGFWVFDIWYLPQFGKTYNQLDQEELVKINDHWSQLTAYVKDFFLERYFGPSR